MEEKNRSQRRWLIPALLAVVVLLLAVILVFVMKPGAEPVDIQDGETPKLGYAEGTTVVEDPDALQKAVDEMYAHAAEGGVTLEYKNDARSTDGENFSCYISLAENRYDMYLQIFADSELTDQLLLTGLIRPGSAFDNISLEHPLDPGTHRVYVAFTQVEEDLETIHAQVMVTMDFTVAE